MANYNPNKVKINRSYSYEELAAVYRVHKNTVATWVINGLPCMKDMRPYLILGVDVKRYLQMQRQERKHKCKLNEFYCMRCKMPTQTAGHLVKYLPLTATKGRLSSFCSVCSGVVNKFTSYANLEKYLQVFDLTKPMDIEHINDRDNPL